MRLKAGKTEYALPAEFHRLDDVYVLVGKSWHCVRELPPMIPQSMDTSDIVRRDQQNREKHPCESIPCMVTVYPPRRGARRSRMVFHPAPSKAFTCHVNYFTKKKL